MAYSEDGLSVPNFYLNEARILAPKLFLVSGQGFEAFPFDILSAVNDGDSKHHCLGFLFL
jgi:hypothetical protein